MAAILEDDDLDLSEEERRRARPVGAPIAAQPLRPPVAPQPIGTAISPDTVQMPQPAAVPLPTPNTVSGTGPLAPRPAAERLTALQEKGLPQYHGAKRFLDTLAGATNIGSAIEAASGLGTVGYKARTLAPAEAAAREEAKQIQEAGTERETEARAGHEAGQEEEARARAEAARQGMENVIITGPGGVQYQVPRKDAERLLGTVVTQQEAGEREKGREETTKEVAQGKEASAEKIATGKEKSAEEIAKERTASAERVAQGRNLVSVEVAKIRADAANDPNKLTNTMKSMKQQAQATLPQIDKALDETEAVAGLLGPTEGRWNNFWQGKVGLAEPKYAHYKDEIAMVSTAVTLAHARGRMSNDLFEHFQKMFDAGKQAPENMIQALNVAKEWLTGYAAMGETPATPGAPGPGNKPKGTWNAKTGRYE